MTSWTPRLVDLVGAERADRIRASAWWPTLVTVVDHALQRGWQVDTLLLSGLTTGRGDDVADADGVEDGLDECQAMVWRASIALDPVPADPNDPSDPDPDYPEHEGPPADMWEGVTPPQDARFVDHFSADAPPADASDDPSEDWAPGPDTSPYVPEWPEEAVMSTTYTSANAATHGAAVPGDGPAVASEIEPAQRLDRAALVRSLARLPLAPSDADLGRIYDRESELGASPVSETRLLEVNAMAQDFFERRFPGSWGQQHLADRFRGDLAGHEHFRPGQAPAGWTGLVQHLRGHGVSDEELLAAGLASTARTGRLIDRFRDRVMFPIIRPGSDNPTRQGGPEILGFVGRRHPDLSDIDLATGERDEKAGPKYLNTADTALFHKGAQLFGAVDELLEAGAVPVIVEGPMDAIAVTLATAGTHVGVAPLGTSLTDDQALQLASLHHRTGAEPVVATDPDLAGQVAAERAFWILTPHGLDPTYARLPTQADPADLLARRGPAALAAALAGAEPLAGRLLAERLDHLPAQSSQGTALTEAVRVVAAGSPQSWEDDVEDIAARLDLPQTQVQKALLAAVGAWDLDPRKPAQQALGGIHQVRERLEAAEAQSPAERWAALGASLDPRLPHEPDWGAAALMIQDAHDQGCDVAAAARQLVVEKPLGSHPARDLRYRLVSRLDVEIPDVDDVNPHLNAPAGPEEVPAGGRPGAAAAQQRRRAAGGEEPGPRPGSRRR